MAFYTQYRRPPEDFEQLSDELIVERAGYIDTKTQIENFIRSGQLLMASRRSVFDDVGEDDDNAPMPPDRYINDPVDIAEQQRVNAVYRQAKAEQAKAEQAKAEQARAEQAKAEQAKAEQAKADKVGTAPTENTENSN